MGWGAAFSSRLGRHVDGKRKRQCIRQKYVERKYLDAEAWHGGFFLFSSFCVQKCD